MLLRILTRLLFGIIPLFLNGCMTHRLWTGEMAEDFYEPSAPNRLILFAAPDQRAILAEYDELSPWMSAVAEKGPLRVENGPF